MELLEPQKSIELDALELEIHEVKVNDEACSFQLLAEKEKLVLKAPEKWPAGVLELDISYTGEINNKMAGFYRSFYKKKNEDMAIAVTQFEESDARRAFPCFDHPGYKAVFFITMVVPQGLKVFSNEDIDEEIDLGKGLREVSFKATPLMSTYLVFFGIGDFQIRVDLEDRRVRAVALEERINFTDFCLDFGRKSLQFLEKYYGVDYPLSKMDLLAVPDFAFGAMENWGAITFRENLMLYYPGVTSKAGLYRIAEVVAHEIVHQWFGNLVTPSDWKYLWLNESFATFFAFIVVDQYFPEWEIWPHFISTQTASAMVRDSLDNTISIEIPGGEHVVINASTAPIIYNKGGSILRQIKEYLGDECFQKGLSGFLKDFAYKNAESKDLWTSLQNASGVPVLDLMKSWVEQPGYPCIQVTQNADDLVFTQNRFTYNSEQNGKWIVPLKIRYFLQNGESIEKNILLSEKRQMLTMPPKTRAYKVNSGQSGFYRVLYQDQDNLEKLCSMIEENTLSPEDSYGVECDLYEFMLTGRISLEQYLGSMPAFIGQSDFLPSMSLIDHMESLIFVLPEKQKTQVEGYLKQYLEFLITELGLEVRDSEKHSSSVLRDRALPLWMKYNSANQQNKIQNMIKALFAGKKTAPDLQKGLLQAAAISMAPQLRKFIDTGFENLESEHQRMNQIAALGYFKEPEDLSWAYEFALKRVPARNRYLPFAGFSQNRDALSSLWDFYIHNEAEITELHPVHFERIAASLAVSCGLHLGEPVKTYFETFIKEKKLARDVISLSLEKLAVYRNFLKACDK